MFNRVCIKKFINKTPYGILRNRKPSLENFRVFGCKVFILDTKVQLTKFDPKSYECVFLGYSQTSKAYIVLNKETIRIEESVNVTFDESLPEPKSSPSVEDDRINELIVQDINGSPSLQVNVSDEGYPKSLKEARGHPIEQVIGELNERMLRYWWRYLREIDVMKNMRNASHDEAKRRNSRAKTNTFEENSYLLPYAVSSKEDMAYQRQLITRIRERKYYLKKDREKEKLRNRFLLIALLEQNPDTYKGRSGTDRYAGRSSSTHYSSLGKPAYKRENEASSYTVSATPTPRAASRTINWNSPLYSQWPGTSCGIEKDAITHVPYGILENGRIENDEPKVVQLVV
ncbi:retrovirus-related pol polyprotein from transposon TNT 1-94 [Tanacetum coccineum]